MKRIVLRTTFLGSYNAESLRILVAKVDFIAYAMYYDYRQFTYGTPNREEFIYEYFI